MLMRTTLLASALLAGFATTASAQTYVPPAGYGFYTSPYGQITYYGPGGYWPYGSMAPYAYQPTGTFQALWNSPSAPPAPVRASRVVSPRQSYAAAIQTPGYAYGYTGMAGYTYQPTGTFQALWESPSAPPAPARVSRAVSPRQSYAAATQPPAYYSYGYTGMAGYAYQPTGTFQALWDSPSAASTPPRANRAAR